MASYSSSSKSQKNCSTCEYWNGDRGTINHGLQVQYVHGVKLGCANSMASRKNLTSGNDSCHKWIRWGALE